MSNQHLRFLRRTLLGGMAGAAAGALLRPLLAHADTGAAPQRLLLIHRPCGSSSLSNGRWFPTGGTTGWTSSPLLSSFTDGKIASLQDQMVVFKGLSNARNQNWLGDAHGSGLLGMMTPPNRDSGPSSWPQSSAATPSSRADPNSKTITAGDQSIDQFLLSQIPALRGPPCPVPSVQLAASTESADQTADWHALRCLSYARAANGGQARPLWPEPSPAAAMKNYFGAAMMNLTPAQLARLTAQNKSVLDFVLGGLSAMKAQVPKSVLPKLQTNADAIRQLEMNLAAQAGGMTCAAPTFPGGPFTPSPPMFSAPSGQGGYTNVGKLDEETYPMWKQHKEIIKTMFMCDLTRVVTFSFAYGNSGIHFQNGVLKDPELAGKYSTPNGTPISNPNNHHDISHGVGAGAGDAQYIIDKYYCDMTAGLLAEMGSTPDIGGGSLLDNTLTIFFSEVSDGNAHGAVDMPILMFGGKFLKMKGGSYLQLGNPASAGQFQPNGHYSKGPAPYVSDLWVTIAQAWGLKSMTTYGDPGWNTGPIGGLFG
ncbi:MAG TPA: DUF1552 domain-containing protein [Polyangia bacterium]|nr:DUF1552 domain-containing protein [Polyangia bacterium]